MTALSTRVEALRAAQQNQREETQAIASPSLEARDDVACVPAAGLDCETYLIQPGRAAPALVVCGYECADGTRDVVVQKDHAAFFLAWTGKLLAERTPLVGHNVAAFDFCVIAADAYERHGPDMGDTVMRRIFDLLDAGLVEDTLLRERLIDLAEGTLGRDFTNVTKEGSPRRKSYGLKALAKRYLAVDLDKTSWRTGYAALDGVPLDEWPQGARDYVIDDVNVARRVADAQAQRAGTWRIPNSSEQAKAAFSFQLLSAAGLRTDAQAVRQYDADLDREARRFHRVVQQEGLIRSNGTKDTKKVHALVERAYEDAGLEVPRTETGRVSTAGAVLEDIALIRLRAAGGKVTYNQDGSVDETSLFDEPLYAYSQLVSIQKLQGTYLPVLYAGIHKPINAGFETILETGRSSWFNPNITNLPRGGGKTLLQRLQARVREAFIPPPGYLLCSVDYDTIELRTLAQVCLWLLGRSKLADALNGGTDPHLMLAAEQFLHVTYEEALKRKRDKDVVEKRTLSKVLNFGLPGGMGAEAFRDFAKDSYDVVLSSEEAKALKAKWLAQWPEMSEYFRIIGGMIKDYDDRGVQVGDVEQFVSGRIRGRARYTAMANSLFQGLAADGAKAAMYALAKACYLREGALFGSRSVAFIHDEVIMLHPEATASDRAKLQAEIMCAEMQEVVPDVNITASPALMRRWYKSADAVYDKDNNLIPWEPK
jgi:hypothetical protein